LLIALWACALPEEPALQHARRPDRGRKERLLEVDCAGGAEFTTLTDAVDAADSGDTIHVAPCTYVEQLDFKGRAIHILGTGGPSVTTIQGPGEVPVVEVHRGEGPGTILEGFTLTNGGGELEPAISEQFSTLHLKDVIITGNVGTSTVYARSAMIILERVTIDATNTSSSGMVIEGRRGQVVLKDSVVACGDVPIGYAMEHGSAFIDGTTLECEGKTAAYIFHNTGRVQRSTFHGVLSVENETTGSEGTNVEGSVFHDGIAAVYTLMEIDNSVFDGAGIVANGSRITLQSSIVTNAACGLTSTSGSIFSTMWTDFWNNTADACGLASPVGGTNIAADPLFLDGYTLAAGSPAIDAGSTSADDLDVDGSRNDMGAFGGPFTQGGGW
jgi:hypothetical protein